MAKLNKRFNADKSYDVVIKLLSIQAISPSHLLSICNKVRKHLISINDQAYERGYEDALEFLEDKYYKK